MAVYTEVSDEQLRAFVALYAIGDLVSFSGIAEGVENSNFMLRTTGGTFILTLYEKRVREEELPFFIALMRHLSARGISCPLPIQARDGAALGVLCGRPAAIVSFLEGMWPRRVEVFHCAALGEAMARIHGAAADFPLSRDNALSVAGWSHLVDDTASAADQVQLGLGELVAAEFDYLKRAWPSDLPHGIIHADLFPDNVFFRGEVLSGVIDFYFACSDALAYDITICLNAWCFDGDRGFNVTKARALLAGYERVRPLTVSERAALITLARGAALRFLLTRLYDWINTPAGALVKRKDPLEYLAKLRFHQGALSLASYGLT